MQLSPQTSFFDPALTININDSQYEGSEEERQQLFTDITQAIDKKCNHLLSAEIIQAALYEMAKTKQKQYKDAGAFLRSIIDMKQKTVKDFLAARRIRENASIAIYKPDLIILDEFQRFRYVIESPNSDGYTIPYMLEYLEWRNEYLESRKLPLPKILLLSATPYKINKDVINVNWGYNTAGTDGLSGAEMCFVTLPQHSLNHKVS